MAWDITEESETVRRLDVSATLRAFVFPAAIAAAIGVPAAAAVQVAFGSSGNLEASVYLAFVAVAALILSPLIAVLGDALARQPLAQVSSGLALVSGGLLMAYAAVVILYTVSFGASAAFDPETRRAMSERIADEIRDPIGAPGALAGALTAVLYGWFLWRTVRVETALSAAPSRARLLGDIGGAGLGPRFAFLLGLPASHWHAGALATGSFWLFILARVMVYAAILPAGVALRESGGAVLMGGVAAGLFVGGHIAFLAAKRLAARRIWKEDEGSAGPVLFLRSFADDQFRFEKSWWDPVGRWFELWSFRRNADEVLIDEFAWYGPVIALGQPGERAAPFGAARRYVDHADWQSVVEDAAGRAHTIVMAAGETPGLAWEYELIARKNHFGKTVFLFPPHRAGHAATRRAIERFNEAFPASPVAPPEKGVLVAAVISGGAARSVTADRPIAQAYLVALRRFLQARETVLGRIAGDRVMPGAATAAGLAGLIIGLLLGGVFAAMTFDGY